LAELTADHYFRAPFEALMSTDDMIKFTLLDDGMERNNNGGEGGGEGGGDVPDDVTVTSEATNMFSESGMVGSDVLIARSIDVGLNSFACHTHLKGPRLGKPGDIILGYDLESWNFGK
jgi:hypothetical protein